MNKSNWGDHFEKISDFVDGVNFWVEETGLLCDVSITKGSEWNLKIQLWDNIYYAETIKELWGILFDNRDEIFDKSQLSEFEKHAWNEGVALRNYYLNALVSTTIENQNENPFKDMTLERIDDILTASKDIDSKSKIIQKLWWKAILNQEVTSYHWAEFHLNDEKKLEILNTFSNDNPELMDRLFQPLNYIQNRNLIYFITTLCNADKNENCITFLSWIKDIETFNIIFWSHISISYGKIIYESTLEEIEKILLFINTGNKEIIINSDMFLGEILGCDISKIESFLLCEWTEDFDFFIQNINFFNEVHDKIINCNNVAKLLWTLRELASFPTNWNTLWDSMPWMFLYAFTSEEIMNMITSMSLEDICIEIWARKGKEND